MTHLAPAKTHCNAFSLLLITLLFSGCGEFAYKRGASSSDLNAAKKTCTEQGPDAAAVEKCLADHGWVMYSPQQLGSMDTDPVVDASVIPSDRRIENAMSLSSGSGLPAAKLNKSPDLLDTFQVSSWWKTGGSAESLQADTAACVARLGEAHRPSIKTPDATRGLLLCMKEKGWSGLRTK